MDKIGRNKIKLSTNSEILLKWNSFYFSSFLPKLAIWTYIFTDVLSYFWYIFTLIFHKHFAIIQFLLFVISLSYHNLLAWDSSILRFPLPVFKKYIMPILMHVNFFSFFFKNFLRIVLPESQYNVVVTGWALK